MYRTTSEKTIDLTPYLRRRRLEALYPWMYTILALWTQYAALGALLLYGLLRLLPGQDAAPGDYVGPLSFLWFLSFFLLLTSYVSDCLLWRPSVRKVRKNS